MIQKAVMHASKCSAAFVMSCGRLVPGKMARLSRGNAQLNAAGLTTNGHVDQSVADILHGSGIAGRAQTR